MNTPKKPKTPKRSETPIAWFNLAHAYLQDAAILKAAPKPHKGGFYEEPVRFLYFHAVELFLKAYLRLKGLEDDVLKREPYRHNLNCLVLEAERRLVITKRVRLVCEAASDFDDPMRDFDDPMQTRYVKTGGRTMGKTMLPSTGLHEAARDLQTHLEKELKGSGIALQPLPELQVVHPELGLTRRQAAKRIARLA
jgi:hypothetical protein